MAEHRTTTRDYRLFSKAVDKWVRKLGLTNYRVITFHKNDPDLKDCYAWFKSQGNTANIGLSLTWDREVTTKRLEHSACHEVLHLLFDDLTSIANNRFPPAGLIEALEEEAMARLEKVLLYGKATIEY